MKRKNLSYVELSEKGCESLHLKNLREPDMGESFLNASGLTLSQADSKKVANAIIKLFESVAIKKKTLHRDYKEYKEMDYIMSASMRGCCVDCNYIVPTEFLLTFTAMYDVLSQGTENIYGAGLERGKNLLIGLSDGTYTIGDFSKNGEKD